MGSEALLLGHQTTLKEGLPLANPTLHCKEILRLMLLFNDMVELKLSDSSQMNLFPQNLWILGLWISSKRLWISPLKLFHELTT